MKTILLKNVSKLLLFLCITNSFYAQIAVATATYNNIGVEINFTTAPPVGTVANFFIKKTSESVFTLVHPLSRIGTTTFAGSAVQLSDNTTYDLKISSSSFADINLSTSTKSNSYNQPNTVTYYVNPISGMDTNSGISIAQAFKTLNKAITSTTLAGTTIYLLDGVYYEGDLSLNKSGTTGNPITIVNYQASQPIIDGRDNSFNPAWSVHDAVNNVYKTSSTLQPMYAYMNGQHLFHYLSLTDLIAKRWNEPSGYFHNGTTLYVRFPMGTTPNNNTIVIPKYTTGIEMFQQSNIVIKGIEFRYFGYNDFARGIYVHASNNVIIDGCKFNHTHVGVAFKRNADFNTVQNSSFNESPKSKFNWDAVKTGGVSYEEGGIVYYTSNIPNKGNVFRNNNFKDLFDGMAPGSEDTVGLTTNLDVHDNTFDEIGDDAISLDGVATNVRVYNNTMSNFLVGISAAPLQRGPTYLFRNVMYNFASSPWQSNSVYTPYPFKFNVGSSLSTNWVYLYHNTSYSDIANCDGFLFKNYSNWYDIVSRNNIYAGASYAFNTVSTLNPIDFDYDDLYTSHPTKRFYWNGSSYPTLATFANATNQEVNGLFAYPSFVSASSANFNLNSSSLLIDKGQVIPGFNTNFLGINPDMGKFEYNSSLGIDENTYLEINKMVLYPNPVGNILNLKIDSKYIGTNYVIHDLLGRVLKLGKLNANVSVLNVEEFPSGIYTLELDSVSRIAVKFTKQ